MKLTIFSLIVIFLILAFAGVNPFGNYKDKAINGVSTFFAEKPNITANESSGKGVVSTKSPMAIPSQTTQPKSDNWLGDVRKSLFPTDEEIQSDAFKLINDARIKAGISPLTEDLKLTSLAREHSLDMKNTGIISHDGFDSRMIHSGYSYVGENCAEGYQNAESLVNGWLNSPGHRANIMNPKFRFTGLSYVNGWATQMFAGY